MRLEKNAYADQHIAEAEQYVEDVLNGKIITNKWIKLACERHKRDLKNPKFELNREAIHKSFRFFSLLNIKIDNSYQQFQMSPFQCFATYSIFGWYHTGTDRRRYKYSFIYIARKNGKTTWSAAMSLYALIADNEVDPEAIILANAQKQATIALNYSKNIRKNSPVLKKNVQERQYDLKYVSKIDGSHSTGFLKSLASKTSTLDGYNPSFTILDEIHEYPDASLLNVIKSGIGARKNPLVMLISTAGFNKDSFCFNLVETCKNILREQIQDDSMFCMLFTLDEDDDYHDKSCWIKANPNIDILTPDYLEDEYNQTKTMPGTLSNFLTKNLNVYVDSEETWIEDEELRECWYHEHKSIDEFVGQDCYMAMDLSSTRDLTCINLLFHDEEKGKFYVFPYFFLAKNPMKKIRKGGIDLMPWLRGGWITECETKTVDYDLLFNKVKEWSEKFNIVINGYDSYNSDLIVPRIEELGIDCKSIPQTPGAFNFPLKYLEKLIYDHNIYMTNPVLQWNFRNVVLARDTNDNIKIAKNKSLDSVDGAVAVGMSIAGWLSVNMDPERMGLIGWGSTS